MSLMKKMGRIADIEKTKYQRKGWMVSLLSVVLLVATFEIPRRMGKQFWPLHIQNIGLFVFLGSMCAHFIATLLIFLMYLPGYLNLSAFHESYKINKQSSWPWHRANWKQVFPKTVYNLVMNQLFVYPFMSYTSTLFGIDLRFTQFPQFGQLFWQFFFVFFIDDVVFYVVHRYSHINGKLYKMHKIHHEYDTVYTLVTEYFHPVDYAIANISPSALGFILLGGRVHCFTFFFYIVLKLMTSSEGHAGYEFPWSPVRVMPFIAGPSFHDHHHSTNSGNFAGSVYILDVLFGTSDLYFDDFLKIKGE